MPDDHQLERLRAALTIDPLRIDEELIESPQNVMDAAEGAARAIRKRDRLQNELKLETAKVADEIRNASAKKPAEAQIQSEALLDKAVVQLSEEVNEATYEVAIWQGLVTAFRAKSRALEKYSDLLLAGFITPDAAYKDRREKMDEKRQQRRRQRLDG